MAVTNTPVPPSWAIAAAERSPSVVMCTSSTCEPVAAVRASATVCDWVRASALARVPRRRVAVVVDKLLHEPTVRVKELAGSEGGTDYAGALRALFGLGIDTEVEDDEAGLSGAVTVDPDELGGQA